MNVQGDSNYAQLNISSLNENISGKYKTYTTNIITNELGGTIIISNKFISTTIFIDVNLEHTHLDTPQNDNNDNAYSSFYEFISQYSFI